MSTQAYRIGIGCVLADAAGDAIRQLELKIAEQTGSSLGLSQPPHVTVKRPFVIGSLHELEEFIHRLRQLVQDMRAPDITYTSIGDFAGGSVYIAVQKSDELKSLHEKLLSFCAGYGASADEFEGDQSVFHTTVAMGLNDDQLAGARAIAETAQLANMSATSNKLVVLLETEVNGWVAIGTAKLSSS